MTPQEKQLIKVVGLMFLAFIVIAAGMFMVYKPAKSNESYRTPFKAKQEAYIENQKQRSKKKNVMEAPGLHERSIKKTSSNGFSSY